jgi:hypothetical protein
MKLLELRAECTRVRIVREQCGLDPNDGHVILIVPGKAHGARKRVAPGLMGRVVGENEDHTVMVDCKVTDVERWLARVESPATTKDAAIDPQAIKEARTK